MNGATQPHQSVINLQSQYPPSDTHCGKLERIPIHLSSLPQISLLRVTHRRRHPHEGRSQTSHRSEHLSAKYTVHVHASYHMCSYLHIPAQHKVKNPQRRGLKDNYLQTSPFSQQCRPCPCLVSPLKPPSYLEPSGQTWTPVPWRLLFQNSPAYCIPDGHVNVPCPHRVLLPFLTLPV